MTATTEQTKVTRGEGEGTYGVTLSTMKYFSINH